MTPYLICLMNVNWRNDNTGCKDQAHNGEEHGGASWSGIAAVCTSATPFPAAETTFAHSDDAESA